MNQPDPRCCVAHRRATTKQNTRKKKLFINSNFLLCLPLPSWASFRLRRRRRGREGAHREWTSVPFRSSFGWPTTARGPSLNRMKKKKRRRKKETQHHANYVRVANALSQRWFRALGTLFACQLWVPFAATEIVCVAVGSIEKSVMAHWPRKRKNEDRHHIPHISENAEKWNGW